ncbi:MAG: tetratricopeptide repeat protein [Terriglobales bacterium]
MTIAISNKPSLVLLLFSICLAGIAAAQISPPEGETLSSAEVDQLRSKAHAGDAMAQLDLGRAYADGNGVSKDDRQAVKWYRSAADQGNATAQNNLGLMLRFGRGVDEDKKESLMWFRKAAKQENPNALFNLGAAYYNGDGVGVDDEAAYAWFLLAQDFGSQSGADAVKRTRAERINAPLKVFESRTFERIGDMYQSGDVLPQSTSKALVWYRKGAGTDSPRVQVKLANLLLRDSSNAASVDEGRRLCHRAADANFGPGAYCVGFLYQKGLGIKRDLGTSAKWFHKAADHGVPEAAFQLGEMYWKGDGLKQDRVAAYKFMYMASISNFPGAKEEKERMEKELTPKQIENAKKKVGEWRQQHPPSTPQKR